MTEPLDLDAIEARARAATPGPWRVCGARDLERDEQFWRLMARDKPIGYADGDNAVWLSEGEPEANAAHIAGLDPDTVLRLVALARQAGRYREALEEIEALAPERGVLFIIDKALGPAALVEPALEDGR